MMSDGGLVEVVCNMHPVCFPPSGSDMHREPEPDGGKPEKCNIVSSHQTCEKCTPHSTIAKTVPGNPDRSSR